LDGSQRIMKKFIFRLHVLVEPGTRPRWFGYCGRL